MGQGEAPAKKEEREMGEKIAGKLSIPRERLPSEERIGEASYSCPSVSMGCTEGSVLRQLSAPRHLSGKGLSRQTQLLLPTLTYLPGGLGTQLTPHDLEIKKKRKEKGTITGPEPGRITTTWSQYSFAGNRNHDLQRC